MELGFNSKDLAQIKERGLNPETVARQINIFKRGNIVVNLRGAATLRNGILALSDEEKEEMVQLFEARKNDLDLLKFVPASGAATRMFKALFTFLQEFDPQAETLDEYLDRAGHQKLASFLGRFEDLPFYTQVKNLIPDFESLSKEEQQVLFVKKMLLKDGLNLGDYPKGLVPFHKYPDHTATAFEEHFVEAAGYAASNGVAQLHFTVAEDKQKQFEEEYAKIENRIKQKTGLEFRVSYSFQNKRTDTLAVDLNNEPFRDEKGNLFFRPGGHGSLLENLNHQDADIVFIRNIDNVAIPKYREVVADHKKLLAGKLLQMQEKIFKYLRQLEQQTISEEELEEMVEFTQKELNSGLSIDFEELSPADKVANLKKKLNRPIRVCGMVKNEGEPGGGPFWVNHETGEISLQIVESAQIDYDNYQQGEIAREATHFNPVDLVCGLKDYKGEKFDLSRFVDQNTSFIAEKTKDGRELKALEHPGLWNGGMAFWTTLFVEVPVETFNPVKEVADLLKPSHQIR